MTATMAKTATIIDGKATAKAIREEIAEEVAAQVAKGIRPPGLSVVIVGADPASQVYVRNKKKDAEQVGFKGEVIERPADTPQAQVEAVVDRLNADDTVDGFLVQLPLPDHIDEASITLRINPDKDADGFHPINVGRLAIGMPGFIACTPLGCKELLMRYGIQTEGKKAVVLGRSNIVGTPMALLLMQKGPGGNATVQVCHSRTQNLAAELREADIIVAAIGRPRFVTADMVKDGAAIIDVGINRIDDPTAKKGTRLVGDVDFEAVKDKVSAITPVPGGVGPMTRAMLLRNTLDAWKRRVGA